MEETGEQCIVVFELIVTPPPPTHTPIRNRNRFRNNLCKDDSALFSRFLHDYMQQTFFMTLEKILLWDSNDNVVIQGSLQKISNKQLNH